MGLKRIFDIFFSLLALLISLPLLIISAILIKATSKGPVFYISKRVGKDGKLFNFYKLRTMVENASKIGSPLFTEKNDKRVTKVGKILRNLKIDEIPQFFNVLKGDMSIIGPRPEVPEIVNNYFVEEWKEILKVKPGIVSLLQVKYFPDFTYFQGNVENSLDYYIKDQLPLKIKYDLEYVRNEKFFKDLEIFLKIAYNIIFKSWKCLWKRY